MTLSISFTSSDRQGSYFPGQIIRGVLSIQLQSDTKIGSISIGCLGIGKVFRQKAGGETGLQTKQETYIDDMKMIFMFNEETDLPESKIRAFGEHLFPFSCSLPQDIPSSFESPQGFVRYKITAYIDGPEYDLLTTVVMFTVNAIYDLNEESKALKLSSTVWHNDEVCCCCFKASNVRASVTINRRAYVPGECIVITGEIGNLTRHPIAAVKATLIQFSVCTVGSARDITLKLPIIIGTVPLRQHLDTFESGSGDGPLPDVDLPTPNFEPCIFGLSEGEKDSEFPQYTPLYAIYSVLSEDEVED